MCCLNCGKDYLWCNCGWGEYYRIEEYLEQQRQQEKEYLEQRQIEDWLQSVVEDFVFPNSDKTLKERYPDVQFVKNTSEGIYFSIHNNQPKPLVYLIPQELL